MPVQKFKTFEEAEKALWTFQPDKSYFRRLSALYRFTRELNPISYPRGVFKYHSLEDAQQQQQEWELEHAKSLRMKAKS